MYSLLHSQVRAALDDEFRTTVEIAKRAGVTPSHAAPVLGNLRRQGIAEWQVEARTSSWRLRQDG